MEYNQFWSFIDEVNQETEPWDKHSVLMITQKKLMELPLQEIVDFQKLLAYYMELAYTPNLWAAATVINDGITNDGFAYFRIWLISQGRSVYQSALKCADTLSELDIPSEPRSALFELYGYVGSDAYKAKSLLEQKSIREIVDNELFTLSDEGVKFVENTLNYYCAYNNALAYSEDLAIKCIYEMVSRQLEPFNVYDEMANHMLSSDQKEKIKSELVIEPSDGWRQLWTPVDLQEMVPKLYGKYQERHYAISEI